MEAATLDIHQDLIERVRTQDRQAQFELYGLYEQAMYNTAYRIVNREDVAQDVLQESFLKAFTKIHQYRNQSSFGAWLKRIVINTSLNALRKQEQLTEEVTDQPEIVEEDDDEVSFPVSVEMAIEALQELPTGYRTVFSLYLLEGYDHQEISEVLGISISTSLTQYQRAKKRLRTILNQPKYHGRD